MKDELEQLVKENKSAFNNEKPSKKVWYKIDKQLNSTSQFSWMWRAAAIVFFLSTVGLGFYAAEDQSQENNLATTAIKSDFDGIESYYLGKISEKKSVIYEYEGNERVVNQHYEQDLQKLNAMYQVLKEEYETNPSRKVIDALTLNLLVRIDILNKEIEALESDSEGDVQDNEDLTV